MWKRLDDTSLSELTAYLDIHSPATCSLYGNLLSAGIRYRPMYMRSGIYFGYYEEDVFNGVIAIFNDGNIMVHINSEQAREAIVPIIKTASYHSVWGLSGWLPQRSTFLRPGMNMDERTLVIMQRNAVISSSINIPPVSMERIDKRRINIRQISIIKQCLWEGFGFESRSGDIRKRIRERTPVEPYWLAYHNKKPVGQLHIHAMTPKYGYIGGVCTLRSERKRGYAKATVLKACQYIENMGRKAALAVNVSNKGAIGLYEKIGFYPIGHMKVYMRERKFKGDENQ